MKLKYICLAIPILTALCSSDEGFSSENLIEPTGIFSKVTARYDHMALPYNLESKETVKKFYGETLGLKVIEGEENLLIDFLGTKLVFHATTEEIPGSNLTSITKPIPGLHFGTQSLTLDEFCGIEKALTTLGIIVSPTKILNADLENEERTLFFKDPIGYVIECRYTKKALNFDPNVKLIMDNEKQGF